MKNRNKMDENKRDWLNWEIDVCGGGQFAFAGTAGIAAGIELDSEDTSRGLVFSPYTTCPYCRSKYISDFRLVMTCTQCGAPLDFRP